MGKDYQEVLLKQRERRKANGGADNKKYEKTFSGKLMRTYRNMQSRVGGILSNKAHLYGGLDIMPKEDFYLWSTNDPDFHLLYDAWVASDYDKKLSPSINRIDTSIGYVLGNVEWLTHSENSRLGGLRRGTANG